MPVNPQRFHTGKDAPRPVVNSPKRNTFYDNNGIAITEVTRTGPSGIVSRYIELKVTPENLSEEDYENGYGKAVRTMSIEDYKRFVEDSSKMPESDDEYRQRIKRISDDRWERMLLLETPDEAKSRLIKEGYVEAKVTHLDKNTVYSYKKGDSEVRFLVDQTKNQVIHAEEQD